MSGRVCPWWMGWILASPLRRLWQDPARILGPFIRDGMTVLEPGPGMGFFTLELARRVGSSGRVVVVDLQPRMLDGLRRRARRVGLEARIDARVAGERGLGVDDLAGRVDFILAFAVVHELTDPGLFFEEAARALRPGGTMLLAEPRGHVGERAFAVTLELARRSGLKQVAGPRIRRTRSAVLERDRAGSGPGAPSTRPTPRTP